MDCLYGIYDGKVSPDILDKYDEIRRKVYHTVTNPISTQNLERIQQDASKVDKSKDPFYALLDRAEEDPEAHEELGRVGSLPRYGFFVRRRLMPADEHESVHRSHGILQSIGGSDSDMLLQSQHGMGYKSSSHCLLRFAKSEIVPVVLRRSRVFGTGASLDPECRAFPLTNTRRGPLLCIA